MGQPSRLLQLCLLLTAGLVVAGPAIGDTLHRCGPDGRTFSQFPCAEPGGREVPLRDLSDLERWTDARDVAAREAAAADALAHHRRVDERAAPRGPSVIPFDRLAEPSLAAAPPPRSVFRLPGEKKQRRAHNRPRTEAPARQDRFAPAVPDEPKGTGAGLSAPR